MAADDLYQVLPVPELAPEELGVSPLGPAPAPPVLGPTPEDTRKRKASSIGAALAALLAGPGAGTGLAQGTLQSFRLADVERQQREQQAQLAHRQQLQDYQRQQAELEREALRRQATYAQNITALRQLATRVGSKEEMERYYQAFATGMQQLGFRVDANRLRAAAPYVAPAAEKRAQEVIARWRANPNNEKLFKDDPRAAAKAVIPFDRDGDGLDERITLGDLAALAQMPFAEGPEGPMFAEPGTTLPDKANADGILATLTAIAASEGKDTNDPKVKLALQQEAIKRADEAKPPDPTLNAIRRLTLSNLQNAPRADYPPNVQRRIDAKANAFQNDPTVKRVNTQAEAYAFVQSLSDTSTSPADDQALIYAFAKAMDPESVVREGEYATVQKYAQSWLESFGFNAARVISNREFLTPDARRNLKETIRKRYAAGRRMYDNLRAQYTQQINQITKAGDGESFLLDYAAAFPSPDGAEAEDPPLPPGVAGKINSRRGPK